MEGNTLLWLFRLLHYRAMPPPFDPHGMPPPGPGPRPGPMMGEPWFDQMPAPPPKGFNHHNLHPSFPPDQLHGHISAHDFRGRGRGGTRREERGLYFNNMQNMAANYHQPMFDMDFSNGPLNSQLSCSDAMTSGGNYLLPPNHQLLLDSEFAPTIHSTPCRYT